MSTPRPVPEGTQPYRGSPVRVRAPATSANLGPGFDALGLALDLVDEVVVEAAGDDPTDVRVDAAGEGAGAVPSDGNHLVARAVRRLLKYAGARACGLRIQTSNVIPHARGLGSSAAATVAGLLAGRALLPPRARPDDAALLLLAVAMEGHPDNAAAALLGGLVVAWTEPGGPRAAALPVHPALRPVVAVPDARLPTATARGVLPAAVSHADAAFTAGRSALLVEALTRRPDLLLPATADRLHQEQRRAAMPGTLDLVEALRARGLAAAVSGAGPSVIVLGVGEGLLAEVAATARGWQVHGLDVAAGATVVTQ